MGFGQNIFDMISKEAQQLILVAIIALGIVFAFKKEFTKFIPLLLVALIAVGFVFNTSGVKDALLAVFNNVIKGIAGGGTV